MKQRSLIESLALALAVAMTATSCTEATRLPVPTSNVTPVALDGTSAPESTTTATRRAEASSVTVATLGGSIAEGTILLKPSNALGWVTGFDLTSGTTETYHPSEGCDHLQPDALWMLCLSPPGDLFMEDLSTGKILRLPVNAARWARWSADGCCVLYGVETDAGGEIIASYDVSSGSSTSLMEAESSSVTQRLDVPGLSVEAAYLAIAESSRPGGRLRVVGSESDHVVVEPPRDMTLTWDLAWSPSGLSLVYGASKTPGEIPLADTILLWTPGDAVADMLASSASVPYEFFALAETVWSPQGDRVALVSGTDICIVEVETVRMECRDAVEDGHGIRAYAWSPSGRFVAFVEGAAGEPASRLWVVEPGEASPMLISDGLPATSPSLWWR